ncbi:MAG: hypothetical protein RSE32_13545 [Comamonas sp.]|uniref:hypothetical protein n=1 Tax=Comamonas sp. TaxID=34028 RepID=UPI002FC58CA1
MEQAQTNIDANEDGYMNLGGKAWTAYAITGVFGLFVALIALGVGSLFSPVVGYIFFIFGIAWTIYRLLVLKSYNLYTDTNGVWIYSGILPWTKGTRGVKWRDIDDATYFPTLFSWMFRSYSIRIGHRFTKSGEIMLSHWSGGDKVAMQINDLHSEMVSNRQLH